MYSTTLHSEHQNEEQKTEKWAGKQMELLSWFFL